MLFYDWTRISIACARASPSPDVGLRADVVPVVILAVLWCLITAIHK